MVPAKGDGELTPLGVSLHSVCNTLTDTGHEKGVLQCGESCVQRVYS